MPDVPIKFGEASTESDRYGEFHLPIRKNAKSLVAFLPGYIPAVMRDLSEEIAKMHRVENPLVLTLEIGNLEIAGVVLDDQGSPLSGYFVNVFDPSELSNSETIEQFTRAQVNDKSWHFETDADGAFRVTGLNRRDYILRIHDPKTMMNLTTHPIPAGTIDLPVHFPVEPSHAMIEGRLISHQGIPIAGVDIRIGMKQFGYGYTSIETSVPAGRSDADGQFTLEILPKVGVFLDLSGDHVVATRIQLEDRSLHDLRNIVVPQRCHVRLVMPETPDFDQATFVDANGAKVVLHSLTTGQNWSMSAWPTKSGDSPALAIGDQAISLILSKNRKDIRSMPVILQPGEVTVIQL
jgi:hypothetical protein